MATEEVLGALEKRLSWPLEVCFEAFDEGIPLQEART